MKEWLESASMYEIYPTSFFDSNGDGVGDLPGITQKLDYVKSLGFDAIWLNPFFCSEFRDGGYDVTDYLRADPRFGTNADVEALLARAHALDLRVFFDLVAGHTSDRHPWFRASQRQERNEYSEHYVWTRDTFTDSCSLPCVNGGSERDGRYILNFFVMQPALNYGFFKPEEPWQADYRSEACKRVREEMIRVITFWLERGADGFRVDMAHSLVKGDVDSQGTVWVWKQIFGEVRERFPEAVFLSEWGQTHYAAEAGFDVDFMIHAFGEGYNSLLRNEPGTNVFERNGHSYFRREGLGNLDVWLEGFLENRANSAGRCAVSSPTGNHDLPRISLGRDEADLKCAFAFLWCMPNLPFVYYGDEIGMAFQKLANKDGGYVRTGARTPMQWTEGPNAGFSTAEGALYLPVAGDGICVEASEEAPDSLLNFVRSLNALKKARGSLRLSAEFRVLERGEGGYPFVFERRLGEERTICGFNPSERSYRTKVAGEIALGQNCEQDDTGILLKGRGFFII